MQIIVERFLYGYT